MPSTRLNARASRRASPAPRVAAFAESDAPPPRDPACEPPRTPPPRRLAGGDRPARFAHQRHRGVGAIRVAWPAAATGAVAFPLGGLGNRIECDLLAPWP